MEKQRRQTEEPNRTVHYRTVMSNIDENGSHTTGMELMGHV